MDTPNNDAYEPGYQQTYYSADDQPLQQMPYEPQAGEPVVMASSQEPPRGPVRRRPLSTRNILIRTGFVIVIILIVIGGYEAYQSYQLKKNPNLAAQQQTQIVLAALSKVMVIPNDPNPVIATVVDKTKLEGQAFFQNAVNGDYVVIFPSAMEAVLYRPSTHQVINIAPLSEQQAPVTAPTSGTSPTTPVATSTSTTVHHTTASSTKK